MVDDYDAAWYGTFKVTLDTPVPTPDSTYWPPEIYVGRFSFPFSLESKQIWAMLTRGIVARNQQTTYDPNWREFIGYVVMPSIFATHENP